MKGAIVVLLLLAVFTGVGALGTGMGTRYSALFPMLCITSILSLLLFFYLAARQSRIDTQR